MCKLRVGIIGCGRVAVRYADALKSLEDVAELVVAVDKRIERAEDFARQFNARYTESISDIHDYGLDVVHICTPHHLHKAQAIECLKSGINVLTEKPMTIDLCDADELIKTAVECGKKLGVIFQNRYSSSMQKVKEIVSSGKLGVIKGAWSNVTWHRPPSYYQCDWKGGWKTEGGGVLIDQAIHTVDLVNWLIDDEIEWIEGYIANRILKSVEVEDVANGVVKYKNGCVYSLNACNYYTCNSPIQFEISGENGTIHVIGHKAEINIGGKTEIISTPCRDHYWGDFHLIQIREFYNSISCGLPIGVDGVEGRRALEIVLGIYTSSKENRKIYL